MMTNDTDHPAANVQLQNGDSLLIVAGPAWFGAHKAVATRFLVLNLVLKP